jgi:hypothetical protein
MILISTIECFDLSFIRSAHPIARHKNMMGFLLSAAIRIPIKGRNLVYSVAELRRDSNEYSFISKSKVRHTVLIPSNERRLISKHASRNALDRKNFRQVPENGPSHER